MGSIPVTASRFGFLRAVNIRKYINVGLTGHSRSDRLLGKCTECETGDRDRVKSTATATAVRSFFGPVAVRLPDTTSHVDWTLDLYLTAFTAFRLGLLLLGGFGWTLAKSASQRGRIVSMIAVISGLSCGHHKSAVFFTFIDRTYLNCFPISLAQDILGSSDRSPSAWVSCWCRPGVVVYEGGDRDTHDVVVLQCILNLSISIFYSDSRSRRT